jgi:isoleucyl-tRNA synthetase
MQRYDLPNALKPILPFVDDASNWYVRRSRRRFWKSDDDGDKANAYQTLHYVLVRLSQAIAPFAPFLAEELYQKLTGGESVHLTDWPEVGHVNELVVKDMETVREYVNQALSLRAGAGIKIRQPLAKLTVPSVGEFVNFEDVLTEELNVKKVVLGEDLSLDVEITPELYREGLAREVVRYVQAARKDAGLNVDDRIVLDLKADGAELEEALATFKDDIDKEVLAVAGEPSADAYSTSVKVDSFTLSITLAKS